MANTIDFLDAAKRHSGIASDYKLGIVLGLTDSAISNYRKGRSFPNDAVAEKLAELAGLDRGYVVVSIHAERAGETTEQGVWRYVLSHLSSNGPAVMRGLLAFILSLFIGGGPDAGAMAATPSPTVAAPGTVCILC